MKWALEPSEFDISFVPRTSLKGQVMADFVTELTPSLETVDSKRQWTLYVDGSSNEKGCGASILLQSPEVMRFEYAIRFNFRTSNDEIEYEALLVGLRMAQGMDAACLLILSDS